MKVVARVTLTLFVAVLTTTTSVDLLGWSSPWLPVVAAASVSALISSSPMASAACALMALSSLQALMLWRGAEASLGQVATHLAAGALLGAAFCLTHRRSTDNSASSQAPDLVSEPANSEDCDED
jgi:hypothetical protein